MDYITFNDLPKREKLALIVFTLISFAVVAWWIWIVSASYQ